MLFRSQRKSLENKLARQLLHPDESILHAGWLWLVGEDLDAGEIATPLAMAPIQVERRSSRPLHGRSVGLHRVRLIADEEFRPAPGLVAHPEFLPEIPLDLPSLLDGGRPQLVDPSDPTSDGASSDIARIEAWVGSAMAELGCASTPTPIGTSDPTVSDVRSLRAPGLRLVIGLGIFTTQPKDRKSTRLNSSHPV